MKKARKSKKMIILVDRLDTYAAKPRTKISPFVDTN